MFHWICPECGREIAPTARECSVCDPTAAAVSPTVAAVETAVEAPAEALALEAVKLATPSVEPAPAPVEVRFELQPEPLLLAAPLPEPAAPVLVLEDPAPLQTRIFGAPKAPASAVPLPVAAAGRDVSPLAAPPSAPPQAPIWQQTLPAPEPVYAARISRAPLREPQPASLSASTKDLPQIEVGPELGAVPIALPGLFISVPPAPSLAGLCDYASIAASRVKPVNSKSKSAGSSVKEQISLPGPTLPHELTSLNTAGVTKILVPPGQVVAAKGSSWVLSFVVAAAVLAGTLAASFYAMPGLANPSSSAPAKIEAKAAPVAPKPVAPRVPVNPLARIVEVTGVRFVTDLPDSPPQIHYLVVNHSNVPLIGVTVNVTLRAISGDAQSPLSQFAFRAPRLGPYESKEMVSSIERFNRQVSLPDWQDLRADIQIAQ